MRVCSQGIPRKIKACELCHAALLNGIAIGIHHGQLYQAEIEGVAGCPNHSADSGGRQVQFSKLFLFVSIVQPGNFVDWHIHTASSDVFIHDLESIDFELVSLREHFLHVRRDDESTAMNIAKVSQ